MKSRGIGVATIIGAVVAIAVVGVLGVYFLTRGTGGIAAPSGFVQTSQYSQGGYTYASYSGSGTTQDALSTFKTQIQSQGWTYKVGGGTLGGYSGDFYEKGDQIAIVSATQAGASQVEVTIVTGLASPTVRIASITVTTTPVDGAIYIDDVYVGTGSATKQYSPGLYVVSFGSVSGYFTPDSQTVTLQAGDNLNVVGSYAVGTASITVTTTPVDGAIYIDSTYVGAGSASRQYSPGTYVVSFGSVSGYYTPDSQTVTLQAGDNLNIVGSYTLETVEMTVDVAVPYSVSSTLLYSLSQDMLSSVSTPLVTVDLTNEGSATAEDVSVKAKLSGYGEYYSVHVGDMSGGSSEEVEITPKASSEIMNLTSDTYGAVQVVVEYRDEEGILKTWETSEEILIKGRNSFSWNPPELVSAWVTPTNEFVRDFAAEATRGLGATTNDTNALEAAERIFEEMEAYGIDYITDAHTSGDYIQFPVQTLKNKSGDCDDLAIIYSSLLESVGIDTKLVLIPGHIFAVIVLPSGTFKPIETTMVGEFDLALSYGASEYQSYLDAGSIRAEIDPTWQHLLGVTPVDITMSVPLPDIDVSVSEPESWFTFGVGCRAKVTVTFTNNGNAIGIRGIRIYAVGEDGYLKEIVGEGTYILELTQTVNPNSPWSREITFGIGGGGLFGDVPCEEIEVSYFIIQ